MAFLDRADMVLRVKMRLNRPATDEVFTVSTTDDVIYAALTEEQAMAQQRLAPIVPDALIGSPVALTSADGGKTYTFGTDVDGNAIVPLGHYKLYASLADIPYTPLVPGADYVPEGSLVRIPSDQSRTFGDGPYAQFMTPTNVINASTEPTIAAVARPYVVSRACARLASERLRLDPAPYLMQAEQEFQSCLAALQTRNGGYASPMDQRYTIGAMLGRF